ncbi:MAG: F-box protein, partial [Alphaproteobacteria bacterium]|nr:F-box protein [Alphaproteobacteria bacterium]
MDNNKPSWIYILFFTLTFLPLVEAYATFDNGEIENHIIPLLTSYPQAKRQRTGSFDKVDQCVSADENKSEAELARLNSLPAEVTFNILGFLPELDLLNVRLVSKPLRIIATESFAKDYARQFYGINNYKPYLSWQDQPIVKHLRVHFKSLHELDLLTKA